MIVCTKASYSSLAPHTRIVPKNEGMHAANVTLNLPVAV